MGNTNMNAILKYTKQKYKKKLETKEKSLQAHIKELDKIRAENRRLVFELNEEIKKRTSKFVCTNTLWCAKLGKYGACNKIEPCKYKKQINLTP